MATSETSAIADWRPGQPVQLESARFVIRSLTPDDVTDAYLSWFEDPDITDHIAMPLQLSPEGHVAAIRQFDNKHRFMFGFVTKDEGRHIGGSRIICDLRNRRARPTTMIGERDFWGKGVAVEARAPINDFLFAKLQLNKLTAAVYAENTRSIGMCVAMGYRWEATLREQEFDASGRLRDIIVFGLLREEWLARRRGEGR